MQILNLTGTIIGIISGLFAIIGGIFALYTKLADRNNPQKSSITNTLNQTYIEQQINIKQYITHSQQNKKPSFWEDNFWIILIAVTVVCSILYFKYLTILRIIAVTLTIVSLVISTIAFIKNRLYFNNKLWQYFSYTGVMLFYVIATISVVNINTSVPHFKLLEPNTAEYISDIVMVCSSLIFIILLSLMPIYDMIKNYRNEHYFWLDYIKYSYFPLISILIYLFSTTSFDTVAENMISTILEFVLSY